MIPLVRFVSPIDYLLLYMFLFYRTSIDFTKKNPNKIRTC